MDSLEGRTLGQYRLIEQVGVGGMAVIYKAYDPSLDRYVAVKILPAYLAHGEDFSARFRNEARNIARLHHPNILPIYGYGEEDGVSYFVMGLVEGGTLKDLMGEPMDPARAVRLLSQVADALQYAHEQGIVHRDVKPANVLMPRRDWPLLSDFGIARVLEQQSHLTHSAFLGTPHYMAPEQARGEPVSPRTDQYALGIVFYEMLTGAPPFQADTPQAVVYQHIYGTLPLPRERNPSITEPLQRVILKALAKDPADRFPDMAGFAEAARAALGGEASPEVRPSESTAAPPTEVTFPPREAAAAYHPVDRTPTPTDPGPSTEQIEPPVVPAVSSVETSEPVQKTSRVGGRPFSGKAALLGSAGAAILLLGLIAAVIVHGAGSSAPHTLLKLAVDRGSLPSITLLDAQGNIAKDTQGNDLSSVAPGDARRGISLTQGRYKLQFAGDSGFNGTLPVTLKAAAQTIDLSRRMAFVRIVPAGDIPLQGAEVDDAKGNYVFDLPSGAAGRNEAMPPGSYLVTFNSNQGYLDSLPLRASAGGHVALNLVRIYARVTIDPPRGAPAADIDVKNGKTGAYLHRLSALQAQQGVYMLPGRYIFDLSSSNAYPEPLVVTVPPGRHTIHLGKLGGGLSIAPIPAAGLASYEVRNAADSSIDYTVAAKDMLGGVFLLPGSYQIAPNSDRFFAPFTVRVRSGARLSLKLRNVYGAISVAPAPGAPLSAVDVYDAAGGEVHYFSGTELRQQAYLLPGRYSLRLTADSTSSATYLDPLSIEVTGGTSRRLNLQTTFAGVRAPPAPSGHSLSYGFHDLVDNTTRTVDAGTGAQVGYVLPGTYRIEITRDSASRIMTVRAVAGRVVTLPTR